jgi:hypothetical protein
MLRISRRALSLLLTLFIAVACESGVTAQTEERHASPRDEKTERIFYPLLARIPIFGAEIDVPDLPSTPGSGASGSTEPSLNAAYMFGGELETRRWFADGYALWAALSASRDSPFLHVDSDTWFFSGTGGVRVAHGFFAILGVRHFSTDLNATIEAAKLGSRLNAHAALSVWDPLVGVEYRGWLSSSVKLDADFRGGGFGVGSDIDLSTTIAVNWRFARHFDLRGGYSVVYFKITEDQAKVDALPRKLTVEQTLHGPEFGIGIAF